MDIDNNALIIAGVIIAGLVIFLGLTIVNQSGFITEQKTDITDVNAAYVQLKTDYDIIYAAGNNLNQEYQTLAATNTTLTTQYNNAMTQVTSLTSDLSTATTSVYSLTTQVSSLTTDKNTLTIDKNILVFDNNILNNNLIDMNKTLQYDLNVGSKLTTAFDNCYWAINCLTNQTECRNIYGQFADLNVVTSTTTQSCMDTNTLDINMSVFS